MSLSRLERDIFKSSDHRPGHQLADWVRASSWDVEFAAPKLISLPPSRTTTTSSIDEHTYKSTQSTNTSKFGSFPPSLVAHTFRQNYTSTALFLPLLVCYRDDGTFYIRLCGSRQHSSTEFYTRWGPRMVGVTLFLTLGGRLAPAVCRGAKPRYSVHDRY